jgi:hypothetical protein
MTMRVALNVGTLFPSPSGSHLLGAFELGDLVGPAHHRPVLPHAGLRGHDHDAGSTDELSGLLVVGLARAADRLDGDGKRVVGDSVRGHVDREGELDESRGEVRRPRVAAG